MGINRLFVVVVAGLAVALAYPVSARDTAPPPAPPADYETAYEYDEVDFEDLAHRLAEVQAASSPPPIPAQPGVGPEIPNTQRGSTREFLWDFSVLLPGGPSRGGQFRRINPPPSATPVPGPNTQPNPTGTNGSGGTHRFVRPTDDPNRMYGTGGAGPCSCLIVVMPDGTVGVFHFSPGDDVWGTLSQYAFPAGCTFILYGGDGSVVSNQTLSEIRLFLDIIRFSIPYWGQGHTVYGLPTASGVWVDRNGTVYYLHDPTKPQ